MDRYREKQYWNVEIALQLMAELDAESVRRGKGVHDSINEKKYLENQRKSDLVNDVRERLVKERQESFGFTSWSPNSSKISSGTKSRTAVSRGAAASTVSKVTRSIEHSHNQIHTRSAYTEIDKQKDSPYIITTSSSLYFPTANTKRISLNKKNGTEHLKHMKRTSLATIDSKSQYCGLSDQSVPPSNDILDSTKNGRVQGETAACRVQFDISTKLDSMLVPCGHLGGSEHQVVRMRTTSSSMTNHKPKSSGKNEESNDKSSNNIRKTNTSNDGCERAAAAAAAGIISCPNSVIVVSTISPSYEGYCSDWLTDPGSLIAVNNDDGVVVISAGGMNTYCSSPDRSSSTRPGLFSDITLPVANNKYVFNTSIDNSLC